MQVPFSGKKRFVVSAAVTEAAFRRHVVAPTSVYEKPFEWYGILENIEECFRPLYETVAAYLEGDLCRSRAKRARIV